jgi:hypothetical protein
MGGSNKLSHNSAETVMLKAKLKPKEPYKDAKSRWKCECLVCGSIVFPRYSTVQQLGAGCKTCRYKKTRDHHVFKIEYVREVINDRGGKLLSDTYRNSNTPIEVECSKGHIFTNDFNHIKRGQWCSTCKSGRSEEITRTTFEQLFGLPFPKHKPNWLINSRGNRMEIDGYCKQLGIGFEYQGIQHFTKDIWGNDIKLRKIDDKLKAKLCKKQGIKLFVITHKMAYKDFPRHIKRQAKNFRLKLPPNFNNIDVDIYRAYIKNDRIEELRELLAPKKISVLSSKYLGSTESIDLSCLVCGHKWAALGNAFFNTRRVAGCDKCSRKRAGEKHKLNLKHLQEFAKKHGGELLSKNYVKSEYDYKWKCSEGHTFEKRFSNMKSRKQFCSICEGRYTRNQKSKL